MRSWLSPLLVWVAMLATAVLGGTLRDKVLVPQWGPDRANQVETLAIAALFAAGIALYVARARLTPRQALGVGAGWCALTIGFETFLGRAVLKQSWGAVAAHYNVAAGRLWPIVLAVILAMPYVAARWRHGG